MKNADKVIYFIFIFIIAVFIFIFIIFLLSEQVGTQPIQVKSLGSNQYLNIRSTSKTTKQAYRLSADGDISDFYAQWNLVPDSGGSGAITFQSTYLNTYIYPISDSKLFTVCLKSRQAESIDPKGWFFIVTGSQIGSIRFQSTIDENLYLIPSVITEDNEFALVELTTITPGDDIRADWLLVSPPL